VLSAFWLLETYIAFMLNYRNLEEMMEEYGVQVDHLYTSSSVWY
jgi:transposase-like protein